MGRVDYRARAVDADMELPVNITANVHRRAHLHEGRFFHHHLAATADKIPDLILSEELAFHPIGGDSLFRGQQRLQ